MYTAVDLSWVCAWLPLGVSLWIGVLVVGSASNVAAIECPNTAKKLANGVSLSLLRQELSV